MNRHSYDPGRASAIVPLLRSITAEIRERSERIAALESEREGLGSSPRERERRGDIEADLSILRREGRMALRELERLGCKLDWDHPLRVLIPGADGVLEHGFAWNPADEKLESLELLSH